MVTAPSPFAAGDRIACLAMPGDPDPVAPGARGTVVSCHRIGAGHQVDVDWDGGRTLSLCIPPDRTRLL